MATGGLLENCIFIGNQAVSSGGAVSSVESGIQIRHCLFLDNTATIGGACDFYMSEVSLEFSTFAGNSSSDGGALVVRDIWSSHVSNCTFWGNGAPQGAAISIRDCIYFTLPITTTIVAANNEGEGLYWDGAGTIELSNVDIWNNTGGDWVGAIADQAGVRNNIALDPFFCGVEENPLDFTLRSDSPCLAENNPGGVLIGAHGLGCTISPVDRDEDLVHARSGSLDIYPNPFNPQTTVAYSLERTGHARVTIHDLHGRTVATLLDGIIETGRHELVWNGKDDSGKGLASGTYLVQLRSRDGLDSRKIQLIR